MRARLAVASDAVRLVHGEADGLPGLVVDRYGDTLSAQFLAAGVERWKSVIADALVATTGVARVYERSDTSAREREGLRAATGWLRGGGDDASTEVEIAGARLALRRRSRRRPQDRLLSRPARQPQALRRRGAPLRRRARPQLLLLHRRLQRRRARRRRSARAGDRLVGTGARARRSERRAQRLRSGAPPDARRRRQRAAACVARAGPAVRRDRPRPAEARADGHPRRARRARLQGHQPARADAARARRRCCSRSRARAASTRACSTRSSPAPASTRTSTASSTRGSAPRPTTR